MNQLMHKNEHAVPFKQLFSQFFNISLNEKSNSHNSKRKGTECHPKNNSKAREE